MEDVEHNENGSPSKEAKKEEVTPIKKRKRASDRPKNGVMVLLGRGALRENDKIEYVNSKGGLPLQTCTIVKNDGKLSKKVTYVVKDDSEPPKYFASVAAWGNSLYNTKKSCWDTCKVVKEGIKLGEFYDKYIKRETGDSSDESSEPEVLSPNNSKKSKESDSTIAVPVPNLLIASKQSSSKPISTTPPKSNLPPTFLSTSSTSTPSTPTPSTALISTSKAKSINWNDVTKKLTTMEETLKKGEELDKEDAKLFQTIEHLVASINTILKEKQEKLESDIKQLEDSLMKKKKQLEKIKS